MNARVFNIRTFVVGGLRFLKLGRITIVFCISRELRGFQ